MKTLLKRNLCYTNGKVAYDDVESGATVPLDIVQPISVEIIGAGMIDCHAWVEEHVFTKWPKFVTLLFFWMIPIYKEKRIFVVPDDPNSSVSEFDFACSTNLEDTNSLVREFQEAPGNLNISNMWILEK